MLTHKFNFNLRHIISFSEANRQPSLAPSITAAEGNLPNPSTTPTRETENNAASEEGKVDIQEMIKQELKKDEVRK